MIKKIKSIKNFHIFRDFKWNNNLDEFNQYNLIYGWNGSGKTTFSNFLRQIEVRESSPDCGDFDILTTTGTINKENIVGSTLNLKVFNQDFIKENIFTVSGEITPIFYLGRVDIAAKQSIESLKTQQSELQQNEQEFGKNINNKQKEIEKFCSDKAKDIKEFLHSAGDNKYNTYNRSNFKNKCASLMKEKFLNKVLPQEKIDELKQIITSNPKDQISPILYDLPELKELDSNIREILTTSVTAQVIERLNRDSRLNSWVRQGLWILKDQKPDSCPFCNQELPVKLITDLEAHFNDEYELFVKKIEGSILNLSSIRKKTELILPSKSDFYKEFSSDFEKHKQALLKEITEYSQFIELLSNDLSEKSKNPFAKIEIEHTVPKLKIKEHIGNINLTITNHNTKSKNFTNAIQSARQKLEEHFVAECLAEYIESGETLIKSEEKLAKIEKKIEANNHQIIELEKKIVEHRTPAEEINSDLRAYLGHEEIKFDIEGEGYRIYRNGVIADSLSEGEKTAVSFIYFLKTLHDKNFDFNHSVVVIDDPISSLDSNFLYNAFGFLKNRTEGAQQLFILTHNYSFFKEVKNWLINKHRIEKSSLYMLKITLVSGQRVATLHPLDNLLKNYTSEYQYLFSLVYKNASSPDKNLENYYLLPNVSRRLLESFFAFRYPTQIGNFGNQLAKSTISEERKTRILRYTDANSHSDHIRSDPEGDLSYLDETPQVLNDILDLIKEEDEKHFSEIISIIKKDAM
jgi:wobble nucleotide-excising tRNase